MGFRLVTQCEDNQLQPELYWSQNLCSALSLELIVLKKFNHTVKCPDQGLC